MIRYVLLALLQVGVLMQIASPAQAQEPSAEQRLEQVRATYASFDSYADTGTILVEEQFLGSALMAEWHSFVTRHAAPRRFLFDFTKGGSKERFVIWSDGEAFSSYWSATQVSETYASGQGANAFAMGTLPTSGAVLLIPPLLFQRFGLQGPLLTMSEPHQAGSETLDGRLHHKFTALVRLNHWSETRRATTVWIDAETHLIGKIFEDTPEGMGKADIQRITTVLKPRVNPKLEESAFRFVPP